MADQSNEETFLAEKVIDSGFGQQDGKRYYKIKWVRYTWECEDTIGHLKELLDVFWSQHEIPEHPTQHHPNATIEHSDTAASTEELKQLHVTMVKPNCLVDNDNDNVTDENLAANTTIEVGDMLKDDEHADVVQDVSLNVGTGLISPSVSNENANESITSISSSQSDVNLKEEEDNKQGKYTTLEKPTCDICLRTCTSAQALKIHKKSHHSDKSFQCEHCFKSFSERSTLKRHMYIHLEEKPFKCDHCERAFSDKSTLRRHMVTHTGAKRFHCTRCDKRFTRNEHLRQHNYIHTAQKLYKCDVCHKDFRQRSTLKNHMLLHRAEGGFTCGACGAEFTRQIHYDKHVHWCTAIITRDRGGVLKCVDCPKHFPDRNALKRHQVIHTGDAHPFKCTYCQQTFNERSHLRRHLFTHTEHKPFQCSLCHREFLQKTSLLSHISTEHSDQLVLEILQPTEYELDIDNAISLEPGGLEQNVDYIMQSSASVDADDSLNNQVEVVCNMSAIQTEGVTILADSPVCGISQDVMQEDSASNSMPSLNAGQDNVHQSNFDKQNDTECLTLHMEQENNALHKSVADSNHLLRVEIVSVEGANDFIQSIQAIVSEKNEGGSKVLPLSIPSVEELSIDSNANSEVAETIHGSESIIAGNNKSMPSI